PRRPARPDHQTSARGHGSALGDGTPPALHRRTAAQSRRPQPQRRRGRAPHPGTEDCRPRGHLRGLLDFYHHLWPGIAGLGGSECLFDRARRQHGLPAEKAAFDPYPFILLNLFLSMLAALQAPVIMMSQNRQAAKDRLKGDLDYEVNLKAELEVAQLHHKVDRVYEEMQANFARLRKTNGIVPEPKRPTRV